MSWIVGDGKTICIWKDPWLPHDSLRNYIEGPLLPHDEDHKVNSLRTNHSWSFESLHISLPPPPNFKTLFRVFQWPSLPNLLILSHGPTIMVLVQLNLRQNFFFTNIMHPRIS